jgi:PPOX class probable FMN-dependent enzyme
MSETTTSAEGALELKTADAVRGHYKEPHPLALSKELKRLDRYCQDFIAASPFYVIATSDAHGRADATPRGDAPGAVVVLDALTLLIPDRRGNNRVDTMMNIAENPHVGLLFLVPGLLETLRVNGRATLSVDPEVLGRLTADGKPPVAAIRVEIEEVYFQCGKALVRSQLWNPERHVEPADFPPFGQVLAEQSRIDYDPGLEDLLRDDYRHALY